jgi:hypothetical protein
MEDLRTQGQAGEVIITTGQTGATSLDNFGATITNEANGQYYERNRRGRAFLYSTPAQALLLTNTTGLVPTIHNPSGSGVNFVPLAIRASFVSGTTVIGAALIAQTLNAGSQVGTASAILTGTHVAPVSAYVGGNAASAVRFYPTTCTFTAAPTVIAASGLNFGAASPTGTGSYEAKLDGSLIFAPGTAMSLTYSVTTSTALWFWTIYGLEIPIVV